MDHLQRLIAVLLLACCSLGAWASGTVTGSPVYQYSLFSGGYVGDSNAAVFLLAVGGNSARLGPPTANGLAETRYLCYGTNDTFATGCQPNGGGEFTTTVTTVGTTCPANATLGGGTCTCNANYVPNSNATACVSNGLGPPVCVARSLGQTELGPFSSSASAWKTWSSCESVAATATTYAGGCLHVFDTTVVIEGASGFYGTFNEKTTGGNCTPNGGGFVPVEGGADTPPPPAPAPASAPAPSDPKPTPTQNNCSLGTGAALCPGGVNGAILCVPCGSLSTGGGAAAPVPKPVAGASAPSGSTGGGGTVPTPDGGSASIPSGGDALQGTTCTGGVCTTKTIIRDNTGATTNIVTTTQAQTDFCAKNPGNALCVAQNTGPSGKPGTGTGGGGGGGTGGTGQGEAAPTFGGTCGAGFTCTGDAVQCAMARDQMLRNCKNFDDAASNDPVVVAAAAGASSPAGHPINSGTSKSLSFDQTNILSGSCPADVSVTVSHFNAVTLPFSSLCTPATWLGNILVGITALSCLGIVFVRGA